MTGRFAIISIFTFILLGLTVFAAQNETGDTTLDVNSPPFVTSVELNDASYGDNAMDLVAATTTALYCFGVAADWDGWVNFDFINASIYSTSSSAGAADDDDNHYSNSSCNWTQASATEVNYNCTFYGVQYYAENDTWNCNVIAVDDEGLSNGTETDAATMNALIAIDIPDATEIDFGTIITGQSSTSAESVTFENEGNVEIDVDVDFYRDGQDTNDAQGMSCTSGNIAVTNFNASLADTAAGTPLVASGLVNLESNLGETTGEDASPTTDIVYFRMTVPGGVGGTCDGTVLFGATVT